MDSTIELSTQRLLEAADRGAAYLADNLQPSGRFVYQRNALTGQPVDADEYSLRRHFGALWAMLDVRGYDPAVQAVAVLGVRWAIDTHFEVTPRGGSFRTNDWLVTGCNGLALLAIDELAPGYAQAAADDIRPSIVDFLLANQLTDGALRHDFHHRIARRPFSIDLESAEVSIAPVATPDSGSATAEIVCGLITYLSAIADSFDGSGSTDQYRFATIYAAVGNAMAALMARGYGVAEHSHWTMYAIRRYAELTDRLLAAIGQTNAELATESRRDLLLWASRIGHGVLTSTDDERDTRCLPTAFRVEAQAQLLDLFDAYAHELTDQPGWGELTESALHQMEQDCVTLMDLQDTATGGFRTSATDPVMRIDHTQHASSALLGAASAISS